MTAKEKRGSMKPTITAKEIRHYIGDSEIASVPEMLTRMGIYTEGNSHSGYVYNTINAQKHTLLPAPVIYGASYYYPVDALEKVVREVQANAGTKKEQTDKMKRLLGKIKSNPELAEMLLGLLDD
jgi:hypothetical protein